MPSPIRVVTDAEKAIPEPLLSILRGVGQIFFQGSALSGICFLVGVAIASPLHALGLLVGAAIGTTTARIFRFDAEEIAAGIHGFNPALVGIATLFFFQPGPASLLLGVAGCVAATFLTRALRTYVAFPTYTSPFILVTWVVFLVGTALSLARVAPGDPITGGPFSSVLHGISQVMFQAHIATAIFFLVGIAIGDLAHAIWVVIGACLGSLVSSYHATQLAMAVDPESLVTRKLMDNIVLGLYGYNATLAAVALYLARRSLVAPFLGMLLSVPLTEFVPRFGLPALTAPFVLATWIVLAMAYLDDLLKAPAS